MLYVLLYQDSEDAYVPLYKSTTLTNEGVRHALEIFHKKGEFSIECDSDDEEVEFDEITAMLYHLGLLPEGEDDEIPYLYETYTNEIGGTWYTLLEINTLDAKVTVYSGCNQSTDTEKFAF